MKVFISYKFRGADTKELRKNIEHVNTILTKEGHTPFNFFGDVENWEKKEYLPGEVMRKAFENIKESDALVALLENPEPSEGMLLEIGYALALKKKVIILQQKNIIQPSLTSLATKVIPFQSIQDLDTIIGSDL